MKNQIADRVYAGTVGSITGARGGKGTCKTQGSVHGSCFSNKVSNWGRPSLRFQGNLSLKQLYMQERVTNTTEEIKRVGN